MCAWSRVHLGQGWQEHPFPWVSLSCLCFMPWEFKQPVLSLTCLLPALGRCASTLTCDTLLPSPGTQAQMLTPTSAPPRLRSLPGQQAEQNKRLELAAAAFLQETQQAQGTSLQSHGLRLVTSQDTQLHPSRVVKGLPSVLWLPQGWCSALGRGELLITTDKQTNQGGEATTAKQVEQLLLPYPA